MLHNVTLCHIMSHCVTLCHILSHMVTYGHIWSHMVTYGHIGREFKNQSKNVTYYLNIYLSLFPMMALTVIIMFIIQLCIN